jgi:hypothetical protein
MSKRKGQETIDDQADKAAGLPSPKEIKKEASKKPGAKKPYVQSQYFNKYVDEDNAPLYFALPKTWGSDSIPSIMAKNSLGKTTGQIPLSNVYRARIHRPSTIRVI